MEVAATDSRGIAIALELQVVIDILLLCMPNGILFFVLGSSIFFSITVPGESQKGGFDTAFSQNCPFLTRNGPIF